MLKRHQQTVKEAQLSATTSPSISFFTRRSRWRRRCLVTSERDSCCRPADISCRRPGCQTQSVNTEACVWLQPHPWVKNPTWLLHCILVYFLLIWMRVLSLCCNSTMALSLWSLNVCTKWQLHQETLLLFDLNGHQTFFFPKMLLYVTLLGWNWTLENSDSSVTWVRVSQAKLPTRLKNPALRFHSEVQETVATGFYLDRRVLVHVILKEM